MNLNTTRKTPFHLWIVGILSLLWNGVGAYDYLATKLGNRDYIASMTEPLGVGIDDAMAYFESYPLWMNIAWAIGVWGAVAGALLLLMRSGFAWYAFVLSLCGIVAAGWFQISNPLPGMTDSTIPNLFAGVVLAITVLLAWYSRAMAKRGVLR